MIYYVYIAIERKEAILDPQGKATGHALSTLGLPEIQDTRIGKLVRLKVEAETKHDARRVAHDAADKLLANPIMETYVVIDVTETPALLEAEAMV